VKREHRLRASADFSHARELAKHGWSHPLLVLYVAPNDVGSTRVGITVSGRVGNAVIRNRVRRRLREALAQRFARLPDNSDIVVSARPASASASWPQLQDALDAVLSRAERRRA